MAGKEEMNHSETSTLQSFAERVYNLDEKVYKILGSGLGRVYNFDRPLAIRHIIEKMTIPEDEHIIRAEIALIGNMARTIEDHDARREVMEEYDKVIKQFHEESISYNLNVLNEDKERLNELFANNMKERFKDGSHLIICISRTFGSAGNNIGLNIADKLHINYYDSEIFKAVIKRMEAEKDQLEDEGGFEDEDPELINRRMMEKLPCSDAAAPVFEDEKRSLLSKIRKLNRYHGLPTRDALFFNTADLILDLAKKQDFVVMGRCAGHILTNNGIPHISIFINAPFETRVRRMMEVDHVDYKTAKANLRRVDTKHADYYNYYTGKKWGEFNNYDLFINSASYGIEGSADFILNMIKSSMQ